MSNLQKLKDLVGMVGKDPYEGLDSRERKLEKLKQVFALVNDGIPKAETETFLKALIEFVKKLQTSTKTEMASLDSKYSGIVESVKKNSEEEAREVINKVIKEVTSSLNTRIKNWDKRLAEIRDGEKGQDADETRVALEASKLTLEAVKPLLPTIEQIGEKLPEMGGSIRDGLELLPEGEKLKIEAIENLRKELNELERKIMSRVQTFGGGGGVGKQNLYYYDLSGSLNGVLKTFSMSAFARIIKIELANFNLRPTIDWTSDASASTITLTDQVSLELLTPDQTLMVYYAI